MSEKAPRDSSDYIDALRRAVAIWPRTDADKDLRANTKFAALVTNDFDVEDLSNQITKVSAVVSVDGPGSSKNVVFEDEDGYPYRASLVREDASGWRLQALKFQCPVCFGEGVNEGQPCTMCGGSGWGVAP